MELTRRLFTAGLGALFAAPAIVRAEVLMPVKVVDLYDTRIIRAFVVGTDEMAIRIDRSPLRLALPVVDRDVAEILRPRDLTRYINDPQQLRLMLKFLKKSPNGHEALIFHEQAKFTTRRQYLPSLDAKFS